MVQIVATDQILLRLALTRMDGDDQPRNALEQLPGAIDRAQLHLGAGDRALAGRQRLAQHIPAGSGDHNGGSSGLVGGIRLIRRASGGGDHPGGKDGRNEKPS
jgi:hypothetical protein